MFRIIFILSLAFGISLAWPTPNEEAKLSTLPDLSIHDHESSSGDGLAFPSIRGLSHVLNQYNPRGPMTCDRIPRICRAKGSPGPDCCRKQCVNVMTDGLNCGECGRLCRYGQACCGGECVSVMYDPRNCGGCKKRCKKGDFCKYGMCDYA